MKRLTAIILCLALVVTAFAGCSKKDKAKYSDEKLIIGYTEAVAPLLQVDEKGEVTGFEADLFDKIFESVKGDLKSYTFEKVEEGYELENDGGFFDDEGKEYSAGLLLGSSTNSGTFNEDYSFTEPIVSNRVIAVTAKNSERNGYADFAAAKVVTVSEAAKTAFEKNAAIASVCASVAEEASIDAALAKLDAGEADIVVTDEFNFMPTGKADSYKVFEGELDKIDYVFACAKYSGWKDSLNEAIYELKNEDYGDGDEFTPMVEKAFGYNASSFNWEPSKTK
ncbi:MAG: transporter substrate-binding domain-containing protein [Eubacterium sp.]|nr:transporter substrate-binding domain-containing protein [Eubacterium sp.]